MKLKEKRRLEMPYRALKAMFCAMEANGLHGTGYIVVAQSSFDKPYSEEDRTYEVSSNNKAFQPGKLGYSIFGTSLTGSDVGVRLDWYLQDEQGGDGGWEIERCYILVSPETAAIAGGEM